MAGNSSDGTIRTSGLTVKLNFTSMRIFILSVCLVCCLNASSQISLWYNNRQYLVTQTSEVRDSTGKSYQYMEWLGMISSGEYDIAPALPEKNPPAYKLIAISKEEQLKRLQAAPKPVESKAFMGKKKIESFTATDMNGNYYDTKTLKGKIVVLNFWFIRCPPCRMERPFLNQLVEEYKKDTNIVFLAVSLDPKTQLEGFLKEYPFKYHVLPEGRDIAEKNKVEQYPTHVIIDKEGKIAFNTVSYNSVTGYWMRKTIDELKKTL
jgi:peroxiredoxin